MHTIKKYQRLLPALYFAAMGILIMAIDISSARFRVSDTVFIVLLLLPALMRRRWMYLLFGLCSTLVCLVFFVAMINIYAHYDSEALSSYGHHYQPVDFIAGFALSLASVCCSVALTLQGIKGTGTQVIAKE